MRDFLQRILEARQRGSDPILEHTRDRNANLIDQAQPGGVEGYLANQQAAQEADPEMEQRLFGNPYVNLFNRLFNR